MDSVSAEIRSKTMAAVKSQRNRSTEWRLRSALVRSGIRGWKLNAVDLAGRPDFVFPMQHVVVFVDGCFWHGCPKCGRMPSSRVEYWAQKIARNRKRDRFVNSSLKRDGWAVLRVWEHQLEFTTKVIERIKRVVGI